MTLDYKNIALSYLLVMVDWILLNLFNSDKCTIQGAHKRSGCRWWAWQSVWKVAVDFFHEIAEIGTTGFTLWKNIQQQNLTPMSIKPKTSAILDLMLYSLS